MTRVWTSYSARHAAQLIGLPESAVRSCIRDGLVGTPGAVPAQLSFRDLAALRTVKALVDAGLPLPRVRKSCVALASTLPAGTSLAELTVESRDGHVHVRGTARAADAGQLALPLDPLSRPRPERRAARAAACARCAGSGRGAAGDGRSMAIARRKRSRSATRSRRSMRTAARCGCAPIAPRRGSTSAGCSPKLGRRVAPRDCFKSALELDPAERDRVLQPRRARAGRREGERGDRALPPGARARSAARRGALQPRDAVRSVG